MGIDRIRNGNSIKFLFLYHQLLGYYYSITQKTPDMEWNWVISFLQRKWSIIYDFHQFGDGLGFQALSLAFQKATQQSVQWIGGILRDLQALFWLRVFPALRHYPSLPANH